ncbi:GntR family transcriptional regulator [Telmatospirillum sp.]|uniref:GntR family transcriptional regulator n=1 Tax=Telmatospirillum sp. TaxID=2079197 RepID=UPI00283C354C|nr:GntR family transcriptional regulator [Telmatospirillum sp.]MDR3435892.1 GntR family transcriptional regulator [Telmatospirillum sp.]
MKAELIVAERKTLEGVIYDELRKRIISLAYKPGEMIFENVVAAEFEVSRTPVRQAFQRLSNDGLIQVLPQRGARVSLLSIAKINETQFVRESLEISAFAQIAKIWDDSQDLYRKADTEITAIIEKQKASVAAQDYLWFTQLDEEYHTAIIRMTGNRTLLSIVNEMRAHLNRIRYLELQDAHHEERAIGHHEEILAAIRMNDVAGTVEKLTAHLKILEAFRPRIFENHRDMFV